MKILFVSSGNTTIGDLVPFIKVQGESLKELGHKVDYFTIKGRGFLGYLRNILPLIKQLTRDEYDIMHAHYSLSGFVTSISRALATFAVLVYNRRVNPKIIVSLMGSDVNGNTNWHRLIRFFIQNIWNVTIVKSQAMKDKLNIDKVVVLPNGVNISKFALMNKQTCRSNLGLSETENIVLFGADPNKPVKNYQLAKASIVHLADVRLITLGSIEHEKVPLYLCAADVLLLTSKWEGSPNIIKEAMAVSCPIVSVNVGDVAWLLHDVTNSYVVDANPESIQSAIRLALQGAEQTNGRDKLISLGLDHISVAKRLIEVYHKAQGNKCK